MAINAISGLSIYEYYYSINSKEKKKESPLADEMKKYGLKPTEDEALNAQLLQQAKALSSRNNEEKTETTSYSNRPWADLMYQLGISFNEDPKDDIVDIKEELNELIRGIKDEELEKEVSELTDYAEKLYLDYVGNSVSQISDTRTILTDQLNNMAIMNAFRLS